MTSCEYIPDAYEAIVQAEAEEKIKIQRYEDLSEQIHEWIRKTMMETWKDENLQDDYRFFIETKFPWVKD